MREIDVIVIGSGFAGSVMARQFAEDGKKVLVIEKRNHVAGNMYDYVDEHGVLVHKYGPHIFHTNRKEVYDYLSQYTEWYPYEHRVLGLVQDKLVPIPFNLKSIELCFDAQKAEQLKQQLINEYGQDKKVTILELKKSVNPEMIELADFIYDHVFKHYTMKQWGLTVEEIDPSVTNRVPILTSYDDRYFQDPFQVMPKLGYTRLFENILNHPNIEVILNTDARDVLKFDWDFNKVFFQQKAFSGPIIFTGAIDQLCEYKFGHLPYRSEEFELQSMKGTYQKTGTINYPTPFEQHAFTRITEYKHLMKTQPINTTIAIEYPYPYDENNLKGNIPYYPIFTPQNQEQYEKYVDYASKIPNLVLLGRLAEYKYYNMDALVYKALLTYQKLK